MNVLDVLQWDLSAVTPYSILDHILRIVPLDSTVYDRDHVRQHAETFVALAANEHTFSLKSPVIVAVASFGAALRGLNPQGLAATLALVAMSCGVQLVR